MPINTTHWLVRRGVNITCGDFWLPCLRKHSGHFVLPPLWCQRLSNPRHHTKVADGRCAGSWWHLLPSPEGFLCPGRQDANFCFLQQKQLYWQLNPCRSQQSPLRAFFTSEFRRTRIPFSSPTFPKMLHSPPSTFLGQAGFQPDELWGCGKLLQRQAFMPEQRSRRMEKGE